MPTVFLYGPDSLQARVRERVGPTDVIGGAELSGYALCFDKPNMKNPKEGLANLKEDGDTSVFGVVYDLSHRSLETLQGYYGGYAWASVEVNRSGDKVAAQTPIARRRKASLLPSKTAIHRTVASAEENEAPEAFIKKLEGMEAIDG